MCVGLFCQNQRAGKDPSFSFCLVISAFLLDSRGLYSHFAPLLFSRNSSFIHSSISFSLRLALSPMCSHLLTFTIAQQIHPSYQQLCWEQKRLSQRWVYHVEVRVLKAHHCPAHPPVKWHSVATTCQKCVPALQLNICFLAPCPSFFRRCLPFWIRRISDSTFIRWIIL